MPKRARKAVENARCCWVCGKLGGAGFSTALRLAGYDVPRDQIGYAHPGCMAYAQRRENQRLSRIKADEQRVLDIAYGRIDLEATHDFRNPLGNGVWRRSTDPDTLERDYEDGMASYVAAPELSMGVNPAPRARPPVRR